MSNIRTIYFSESSVEADFFNMFCGEKIGAGVGRAVYEYRPDPRSVVKIEYCRESFQNALEWETWRRVMETDLAKWFAPCEMISPCGIVMVQKKTKEKPPSKYPDKIPSFFTDTKYENFGFIGNQLVCHDYGIHLLMEKGMNKRLRKANWW